MLRATQVRADTFPHNYPTCSSRCIWVGWPQPASMQNSISCTGNFKLQFYLMDTKLATLQQKDLGGKGNHDQGLAALQLSFHCSICSLCLIMHCIIFKHMLRPIWVHLSYQCCCCCQLENNWHAWGCAGHPWRPWVQYQLRWPQSFLMQGVVTPNPDYDK